MLVYWVGFDPSVHETGEVRCTIWREAKWLWSVCENSGCFGLGQKRNHRWFPARRLRFRPRVRAQVAFARFVGGGVVYKGFAGYMHNYGGDGRQFGWQSSGCGLEILVLCYSMVWPVVVDA